MIYKSYFAINDALIYLTQLKNDITLWQVPKGAGGQDQYAGMPPGFRLLDLAIDRLERIKNDIRQNDI